MPARISDKRRANWAKIESAFVVGVLVGLWIMWGIGMAIGGLVF